MSAFQFRVRSLQIIPQDNRSGDIVNRFFKTGIFAFRRTAARARFGIRSGYRFLRFPGTQPLIHQFHRKAEGFVDAVGETPRLFRHFARRAVQMQRQPNHDSANTLLADQFTQARKITAAVRTGPCGKRARSDAALIGQRQAQPFSSVVDGQNHTRDAWITGWIQSAEGNCHTDIITRTERFSEAVVLKRNSNERVCTLAPRRRLAV